MSTFEELKPYLGQSRTSKLDLFEGGSADRMENNQDNTRLGLISKLYRLSAEAKVFGDFYIDSR